MKKSTQKLSALSSCVDNISMLTDNVRIYRRTIHNINTFNRMNNKHDDTSDNDDDVTAKTLQNLVQCPACLRRMRHEVFAKHPNLCHKNPLNKRNVHVFDMTQYRSIKVGDKITPVCKVSPIDANKPTNISVRPSQTRSAKRDRRSDALVPPVIDNFCTYLHNNARLFFILMYIGCPICKRTFCEKAYDRHVAFCSSKTKQIQQPPSEEILLARLKLDRRIKFRSNRVSSTPSKITPPASTSLINKEPPQLPKIFCLLPLRKKISISLAHCPWCSKPYLPNCVHYCRNSKELFPIHS
jgi:hypothetical protein